VNVGLTISDEPSPGEFQKIALATKERPDAQQIHSMLLRSMQQAIYTPVNSGHFGLAYAAYTHFTSPIRRYPDLLVHRVIKAILAKRRYQLPELPVPGEAHAKLAKRLQKGLAGKVREPDQKPKKLSADQLAWQAAGLHCSANERRADEASRDVEAWLKCKFMREHLGEEYSGVVTSAAAFGIFVTLDELYVEGMVHITELGGEYFRFDEARQELRGERSGMRYAIGTRVRVQVSRVDLDGRKIDFRLVHDGEELTARAMRDKGIAAAPGGPSRDGRRLGAASAPSMEREAGPSVNGLKSAVKKAASGKGAAKARKTRR
jgi:ribonuclease R